MEEVKFPHSKQAKLLDPNLIRRRELMEESYLRCRRFGCLQASLGRSSTYFSRVSTYYYYFLTWVARLAGGAAQLDVGGPVG